MSFPNDKTNILPSEVVDSTIAEIVAGHAKSHGIADSEKQSYVKALSDPDLLSSYARLFQANDAYEKFGGYINRKQEKEGKVSDADNLTLERLETNLNNLSHRFEQEAKVKGEKLHINTEDLGAMFQKLYQKLSDKGQVFAPLSPTEIINDKLQREK